MLARVFGALLTGGFVLSVLIIVGMILAAFDNNMEER